MPSDEVIRLDVSGFQIGDLTIFAIKQGEKLISSGVATLTWKTPKVIQLEGGLTVQVETTCDDPKKVGTGGKMPRIQWNGFLETDERSLAQLEVGEIREGAA